MRLRRLIKTNALHALRRHWSRAAAIALVLMVLSQVFATAEFLLATAFDLTNFIDPFGTAHAYLDDLPTATPAAVVLIGGAFLLRLILIVPLKFGTQRWFYRAGDGRPEDTLAIFEYFSSMKLFRRAVGLGLSVMLRFLLWALLFLAPPCAVLYFADVASKQAGNDFQALLCTGLEVTGAVLLMLMLVFLAIRLMSYYLVPFALADSPEESVGVLLRRSVQASRGHRWALLCFELSMLGWRLLELLIVPRLFTYPYRSTAQGLYAHYLFERGRRNEAVRQSKTPEPQDATPEPRDETETSE